MQPKDTMILITGNSQNGISLSDNVVVSINRGTPLKSIILPYTIPYIALLSGVWTMVHATCL